NGLIRAMLEQVADRVTALVHAPASHADTFDAFGAIIVESWRDRPLDLPDAMIRVVDQPRDQACAVLRAISQLNESQPFAADEITVGLGDEMLAPTIERTLELAGVPVHRAAGRDTSLSPPVLLLAAMARFA